MLISANYIFRNFNYCLEKGEFPCVLKHADFVPVDKKRKKPIMQITDR